MNIYPRFTLIVCVIALMLGCRSGLADKELTSDVVKLCDQATNGQLDYQSVPLQNPHINSYLFACSVAATVPSLSMKSGEQNDPDIQKQKKIASANYFLSSEFELNYKNDDNDNLLIIVTNSFFPETWKEEKIKMLLQKGIDPTEKNNFGDDAIERAKFRESKGVTQLLKEAIEAKESSK